MPNGMVFKTKRVFKLRGGVLVRLLTLVGRHDYGLRCEWYGA